MRNLPIYRVFCGGIPVVCYPKEPPGHTFIAKRKPEVARFVEARQAQYAEHLHAVQEQEFCEFCKICVKPPIPVLQKCRVLRDHNRSLGVGFGK